MNISPFVVFQLVQLQFHLNFLVYIKLWIQVKKKCAISFDVNEIRHHRMEIQ